MGRKKGDKNKHHKEKPHKEKKQRGRPKGSIKQKQSQHQNVNVKVINNNGGGGGGGGDKKITIPVPFQLPSTVYDPSLIQPNYGINDRQPVNPLTDASTDLMTPFIQSMISNQIANRPTNQPTAGKIKEKDVTPVNPVITKPIEQPAVNPQTDQSHPIKPDDVIIDTDIQLPIHNKHIQHKKTVKDMIKPQVPPEIKPPKIKDTEGLGKRIPIENIEGIASTIATGALTGGIVAGSEALITGGLTGLLGAGESIAAGSVGAGVGSGVGYALGAGPVSQVVSGVVGGLAGRTAIRTARNRPSNTGETQPLLENGNRLGGRTGRSRLVDSEISEETIDPTTFERTQWMLPTEEQRTMLDRVKKAAKRTMNNISDTVSNIRQQITGRARKGGTYARLDNENFLNQQDDVVTDKDLTDLYKGRQETIKNFKAEKIQKVIRGHRARKNIKEIKEFREQDLLGTNKFTKPPTQEPYNEIEMQVMRTPTTLSTEFQSKPNALKSNILDVDSVGGMNEHIKQRIKQIEKKRQNAAATTLQTAVRGKKARGILRTEVAKQEANDLASQIMDGSFNDLEQIFQKDIAASKLQTALRRQKAQSDIITAKKVRQQKIQKGKEIFEDMRQKRYNDYLQEDASVNLNALSKKAIMKQQKRLQTELTRGDGAAIALGMKQDEVIDNFGMLANRSLKSNRQGAIKKDIAATKIQSAFRNKQADTIFKNEKFKKELNKTADTLTRKILNRAKKEIKSEDILMDALTRKGANQLALRKGIKKVQNKISELDTRPPNKIRLTFSKKKGLTELTPRLKAEEKQYLRKIEEQYKKQYTPLREPTNTAASSAISVSSSRLSTAGTLGYRTPAKKK